MLNLVVLAAALLLAGGEDLPVDRQATPETRALYLNLKKLSGQGVLFGQQDALAYGVGRSNPDSDYCDVRDVCGD